MIQICITPFRRRKDIISSIVAALTRRTDRLMLLYLALTGVALILPPSFPVLVALHLAAGIAIYSLRYLPSRSRGIGRFFRDWYPAIAFPILYKEVELLASTLGDWRLTGPLQNLEATLFAGQPSLYLSQRLSWVWLSGICAFLLLRLRAVVPGDWRHLVLHREAPRFSRASLPHRGEELGRIARTNSAAMG